jgi:hypothetical protein
MNNATLSAQAGPPSTITPSAGSFINAGLRIGDVIRVPSGLVAGDLNRNLRITGITDTVITVAETLTADAGPEAAWEIDRPKKLLMGTAPIYFTFEEEELDIGESEIFTDCEVGKLSLEMKPSSMVMVTFDERDRRCAQKRGAAEALDVKTVLLRHGQRQRRERTQFPEAVTRYLIENRAVDRFKHDDPVRIDRDPLLRVTAAIAQDRREPVSTEQHRASHLSAEIEPGLLPVGPAQEQRDGMVRDRHPPAVLSLAVKRGPKLRHILRDDLDAGMDGRDLHRGRLVDQEPGCGVRGAERRKIRIGGNAGARLAAAPEEARPDAHLLIPAD